MSTIYERHYGYLYDAERTVKEDAANIRRHIKSMQKAGLLPDDWKFSVRYRTASMCRSIDINAVSPHPIMGRDYDPRGFPPRFVDQLADRRGTSGVRHPQRAP